MKKFYRVLVSATSAKEANKISDILLNQKLIAGALITVGLSKHWWNRRIDQAKYYNISAFTIDKNRNKIIKEVEKIHKDECPIIAFSAISGNKKFLNWIKISTK